ncbi:MAG: ribonuclease III domain-containing protein, partial [archaeon]|nr:ribonuclease III domain-containing protein [archaeon]
GMEQEEFEQRVRSFLTEKCGWESEEIPEPLYRAFVTKSFGNRDSGIPNNESLVFYGRTVVDNVIASRLYALGCYEPGMMAEARNYCMFPNAYAFHLLDQDMDVRSLLRITISRDRTNVDVKLNYIISRINDAFEALVGALDLVGRRDLAENLVQRLLLDDALRHCEELKGLGDAEMRKRWKRITFQRNDRFKAMCDGLVVFEEA